jgi:hypothetical protein
MIYNKPKEWKLVSQISSRFMHSMSSTYVNTLTICSICHILLRYLGHALFFP